MLRHVPNVDRDGYKVWVDDDEPTVVYLEDMDGNLMKFDASDYDYEDLFDQLARAFEHQNEWTEIPLARCSCPKCGEPRQGYVDEDEDLGVVCNTCGYGYSPTIVVQNPWSGEIVEIDESEVTQEKLDAMALLMDDEIRETVHTKFGPATPGRFFALYAIIVGAERAGILWFS